jgi:hypothetical protein
VFIKDQGNVAREPLVHTLTSNSIARIGPAQRERVSPLCSTRTFYPGSSPRLGAAAEASEHSGNARRVRSTSVPHSIPKVSTSWFLDVRDGSGQPLTAAEVALMTVPEHPNQPHPYAPLEQAWAHQGSGRYTPGKALETDAPAQLLLIVRHQNKSPVALPLRLSRDSRGDVVPQKAADLLTAGPVHIQRVTARGQTRVTVTLVVTMYDARDFVLLSGHEYEGKGTRFHLFAEGRRLRLLQLGATTPGSITTSIHLGLQQTTVYARSRTPDGWSAVYAWKRSPTGRPLATKKSETGGEKYAPERERDFSIVDFYKHLDLIGKVCPGSVSEAGIFSHSYSEGPILFDTYDRTDDPVGPRAPDDFDGREKDFLQPNAVHWPDMPLAFANKGRFWVWGCRADGTLRAIARAAGRLPLSAPDGSLLSASFKSDDGLYHYRERLSLAAAKQRFAEHLRSGYVATAATLLPCEAWGSPPGLGANFLKSGRINHMRVTDDPNVRRIVTQVAPDAEFEPDGYLNYKTVRNAQKPANVPFSDEACSIVERRNPRIDAFGDTTFTLPTVGHVTVQAIALRHSNQRLPEGLLHRLDHAEGPVLRVLVRPDGTAVAEERLGSTWRRRSWTPSD